VDASVTTGHAGDTQAAEVGSDSVDELAAAYGDKRAGERDAAPAKQAPES
jgi:hypothetical protein